MEIRGTVISVALNTKIQKQGGGSYDAWELVYRSPENEVKQLAKPVQSLKFTKGLKESLESLSANDEFTAVLEKNARDYWEVQSVVKGVISEQDSPAPAADKPAERPVQAQRAVNRVTGSTYETPEERAKKQVIIVKQSSIAQAVAYLSLPRNEDIPTLERVIEIAEVFDKFAHKGLKAQAKKYLDVKLTEDEDANKE